MCCVKTFEFQYSRSQLPIGINPIRYNHESSIKRRGTATHSQTNHPLLLCKMKKTRGRYFYSKHERSPCKVYLLDMFRSDDSTLSMFKDEGCESTEKGCIVFTILLIVFVLTLICSSSTGGLTWSAKQPSSPNRFLLSLSLRNLCRHKCFLMVPMEELMLRTALQRRN